MTTPGPWSWGHLLPRGHFALHNAEGRMVMRCDQNRGRPEEDDAALIASAPELSAKVKALEAQVEELRRWVEEYGHHDSGCAAHPNQRRTSCEGHCDCGWAEIKAKYVKALCVERLGGGSICNNELPCGFHGTSQ